MHYLAIPSDLTTPIRNHDFASATFDNIQPHQGNLQKLYVLISTPRSGSTALCAEIYRLTGLVIHEYLQPFQYMPSLATRYRVIEEADQHESASTKRIILLNKYIDALVTHRAKDGVLGINCHISHLIYLDALIEKAKIKNPKLRIYKDYLHRHDKYSQAASYAIAKQTRIWSTKRKSKEIATSQLNRLKLCIKAARCYKNLVAQDQLGLRGRLENDYGSILAYETDIQTNITETAAKIVSTLHLTKLATIQSDFRSLERQASSLNGEIATRIREHMAVFLFLGLLDRPLGKVATMVVSIFKRLGAEKAPPKLRFWLEISNP